MEHDESLPTPSQTTSITEDSSKISQIPDASIEQTNKLSNLNIFLSGVSTVKHIQGSFVFTDRTLRRDLQKNNDRLAVEIEAICPKEKDVSTENIVESLCSRIEVETNQSSRSCEVSASIIKRYMILQKPGPSESRFYQFWLLKTRTVKLDRYYAAQKHISDVGWGLPIQEMKQIREKNDQCQLEPFHDFLTSSHIIKDQPFGERKLKLSTGEIISTPNVIRAIAPASIIRQYKQLCEDKEIRPLGTSTRYKFLQECAASVRHSVEGFDYYVAEGGRAYGDIGEILEGFDREDEDIKKKKADPPEVKSSSKSYMIWEYENRSRTYWNHSTVAKTAIKITLNFIQPGLGSIVDVVEAFIDLNNKNYFSAGVNVASGLFYLFTPGLWSVYKDVAKQPCKKSATRAVKTAVKEAQKKIFEDAAIAIANGAPKRATMNAAILMSKKVSKEMGRKYSFELDKGMLEETVELAAWDVTQGALNKQTQLMLICHGFLDPALTDLGEAILKTAPKQTFTSINALASTAAASEYLIKANQQMVIMNVTSTCVKHYLQKTSNA